MTEIPPIPTLIPELEPSDFAMRILSVFPTAWTSTTAIATGGILYSLFEAMGAGLAFVDGAIEYAQDATRLADTDADEEEENTSADVDSSLDLWAQDYFGNGLLRQQGESNSQYRARISANLFNSGATRTAIALAIQRLTGTAPRMMEPWAPGDTFVWDDITYWDVDGPNNPDRWGDPALRYQGFVDTIIPIFINTGGNPVYGWDLGSAWNINVSLWWAPNSGWQNPFLVLLGVILSTKAEGTIVWERIVTQQQLLYPFMSRYNQAIYNLNVYF